MPSVRIVLACIALACAYGVVHDQVTVRLSIEYFTLAHAPLGLGEDPTLLGLAWGVLATWWVGLGLGLLVALAARAGRWPRLALRELRVPLAVFVALLLVLAMTALMAGWAAGVSDRFRPPPELAARMPYERWKHFTAAQWAHEASYFFGFLGGLGLCAHVLLLRWRRARGLGGGRAAAPQGPSSAGAA